MTFTIFIVSANAKVYTLVVEPIYPSYQSKEVFEPLKQWLTIETGYEIEIVIDISYGMYWKNAKGSNMPDFSFDASHIASYRQQFMGYKPIATTVEPVSFHLIALEEPNKNLNVQEYFTGKKVVMLPKPSYANQLFNLWFTDLFSSPYKDVTALSWQDTVDSVFDETVDAAIVPSWMLNLYPNLTSLLSSKELPGSTFMASPNVPNDVIQKMKAALLSLADSQESYEVLVELNTQGLKKSIQQSLIRFTSYFLESKKA